MRRTQLALETLLQINYPLARMLLEVAKRSARGPDASFLEVAK